MAVSDALIQAYASQFLPQFRFADTEEVFPVSADSWLAQCAQGDWQDSTDPHRGTTIVVAPRPLSLQDVVPTGGCRGVTTSGPVGQPLSASKPLPAFKETDEDEVFIDFAGWSSLESGDGFIAGDADYVKGFYESYFSMFDSTLAGSATVPTTRTSPPVLPTEVSVYCEAASAGPFTRASIAEGLYDFATAPTNNATELEPDPCPWP
jgi:hypothetical protein